MSHPTLSVLIVTHNERELVERCLPPLVGQLGEDDELIVADNCSSDGTIEAVERLAPAATVIRMPANDGLMPACNAAAERAGGDLLVKLDADAVVGARLLRRRSGARCSKGGAGTAGWAC